MANPDRQTRNEDITPTGRTEAEADATWTPWQWSASTDDAMAVARIRRTLCGRLARHATPDSDIDGAEVILGELLANVARHAPGSVSLRIDWEGVHPTLVIIDNGDGFRAMPQTTLSDLDAERGRGLALVRALSVATVIGNRLEGGACVRVILPVRRQSESSIEAV